jgi:hypothetical protein
MSVKIEKNRDSVLQDYAVGMLKDFYLIEGEKTPQEAYKRAATAWSGGDDALAQRLQGECSQPDSPRTAELPTHSRLHPCIEAASP